MSQFNPDKEWDTYYYPANGREQVNVGQLFQRRFGCAPSTVEPGFKYNRDIITFLDKNGTCLTKSLDKKAAKNTLDSMFETERGGVPTMRLNEAWYEYKDQLVWIWANDTKRSYEICIHHLISQDPALDDFKSFVISDMDKHQVSILLKTEYGLDSTPCDVKLPKDLDLDANYGEGFKEKTTALETLLNKGESGLVLFHGAAGTGKSTFIKYLSTKSNREFIYIPVGMVGLLAAPDMLGFLTSKKGCVLVLEDAEKAVRSREDGDNGDITATILNMTDGILGNILNIAIIATYNASRETVDKALLRKGRLTFEHEFGPLSAADADRLLAHLGQPKQGKSMTLAEIYYLETDNGHREKERRTMGFFPTPDTRKGG